MANVRCKFCYNGREISILAENATRRTLAQIFGTTEESIYIEDPMGQVYMPNRNGLFESLQQTMTYFIRAEQGIHRPNAVAQLPLNVPGRHTPAPLRGLVNIKIYSGVWHADKPVGTTYEIVSVRPPLTLDKVTQAARDLYGVEEHLLFGVDGIKIPNSVETQEAFWTHHSRRLYLLPPREPREERRQSKRHRASSVTGEEAMTLAIGAELHKIRADIGQIKDTIMTNVKIDIRQNLKDVIFRSLKCIICLRAPMKPPAAFQRCCQSIIGCMTCVETIYQENMGMGCPKCRAPRGCSNMSDIHGLDELLNGLAFLAEEDDNDDDGLHI